jgi:hypothetical protein
MFSSTIRLSKFQSLSFNHLIEILETQIEQFSAYFNSIYHHFFQLNSSQSILDDITSKQIMKLEWLRPFCLR